MKSRNESQRNAFLFLLLRNISILNSLLGGSTIAMLDVDELY